MTIDSLLPDRTKSNSEFSICSIVGFITKLPSTLPTLTEAIGPLKGISDNDKAKDAPKAANTSGSFSSSKDITLISILVSLLKPSANKGLRGLSVSLEESISFSVGLASLLKKPPGIFPDA